MEIYYSYSIIKFNVAFEFCILVFCFDVYRMVNNEYKSQFWAPLQNAMQMICKNVWYKLTNTHFPVLYFDHKNI